MRAFRCTNEYIHVDTGKGMIQLDQSDYASVKLVLNQHFEDNMIRTVIFKEEDGIVPVDHLAGLYVKKRW
jgi:hypothetical protein